MQLLGNLGVDLGLLFAQIVNFLFLLWLLSKFVYNPLIKRIESDEAILAEVKKAQIVLEERKKDFIFNERKHIIRYKNKAKSIINEAEEIAESIKKTAYSETESEKRAVIAQINQRLAEISHD